MDSIYNVRKIDVLFDDWFRNSPPNSSGSENSNISSDTVLQKVKLIAEILMCFCNAESFDKKRRK